MTRDSEVGIVLVYPEVLGTYGDQGNASALAHRARVRDIGYRVLEVGLHEPLPRVADIYLLGGGEDASMLLAWRRLQEDRGLLSAVDAGGVVLGVCAGFQLLSTSFAGPDGTQHEGLGLLDARCGRLAADRAVGEVLVETSDVASGFLTGFENHQGDAKLGAMARPLGRVVRGLGNGDGTEGAVQDRVIGTYLHGPALVRNDELADRLLELLIGELDPYVDEPVRRLREERRSEVLRAPRQRSGLRRLTGLFRDH